MSSEIIENDTTTQSDDGVEKKPKQKREYVMTDARKQAFERCRAAREQSIKRKEEDKLVKAVEIKEKRKKEVAPKIEQVIEAPPKEVKKSKPKKKVIVYEPSDSDDSESSYEVEIRPKAVKKTKPQRHTQSMAIARGNTPIDWGGAQEQQPQETMVKLSDIVNWI